MTWELEDDVTVIQLPIERAYVASTSMMSLLDAIDGLDQVKLVAVSYTHLPASITYWQRHIISAACR